MKKSKCNKTLLGSLIILSVFSIISILSCPAPADEGSGPVLPKTGQTTSYDANANQADDGALQVGKSWAWPRFIDNDDGVITDNNTGLIWVRDANLMVTRDAGFDQDSTVDDGNVTWQHALDYVAKLNAENYLGHDDWRLPSINELTSLFNAGANPSSTWLETQGFDNVGGTFWSGSAWWTDYIHRIDFVGGELRTDYSGNARTWPVRGSSTILFKTGQTTSFDGNTPQADDGALQTGADWPDPRFTDNGDGTITDEMTTLMWIKDAFLMTTRDVGFDSDDVADDGKVTWQHALDYVAKLNAENYLGHDDWRLPNRTEYHSLLEVSTSMATNLAAIFDGTWGASDSYWTSTTSAVDSDVAYTYSIFDTGASLYYSKTTNYYLVWAVRGGT